MRRGTKFGYLGVAVVAVGVMAAVLSVTASGGARTTTGTATLTATGSGSVTFAPDMSTLSFGASTTKPTAAAAIADNATSMDAVIAALKQAGASNVSTLGVSLSTQYNQRGTAVTGFTASNAVQASIAVGRVGALIDAAVAAGATSVGSPEFSTSQDQESMYRTALRAAITQAQSRATATANAAGLTLGPLVSITPDSNGAVATPAASSAGASTPILPPSQQVTASVTLVYDVS